MILTGPSRLAAPRSTLRAVAAAQALGGAYLAACPERAIRLAVAPGGGAPPSWIVQSLGLRSLVQGIAEMIWPTPGVAWTGAAVDGTHAASMVLVAGFSRRYRRSAACSGAVATLTAAALAATAARGSRRG